MAAATELVWLKRDLRVADHAPLFEAAARGPVAALYLWEPIVVGAAEFDGQHLAYLQGALAELSESLWRLGIPLLFAEGDAVVALERLRRSLGFVRVWSHEETGLLATYRRDQAVAAWAREVGVQWTERPQTGVVRRLRTRDGWAKRWHARMSEPIVPVPESARGAEGVLPDPLPVGTVLGVAPRRRDGQGQPGESSAARVLDDFLAVRSQRYRASMSAPGPGWDGCSRLSEHLAFGALSMRQTYQATARRLEELRADKSAAPKGWVGSLSAFAQRLRWHCHFEQKLEDAPDLESVNLHRGYDGLRESEFDTTRFAAWCEGRTGYPMVDACMRSLLATGWLNFRMRAMLVSFASYHLWLHWRETGLHLGRQFLDFEPGIHWAQVQMQSGTTGMNTLRMYNPAKQLVDHDPEGTFVRRWCPELAGVPLAHLPEPHLMDAAEQRRAGCRIGREYPSPIVDSKAALALARTRFRDVRRDPAVRAEAAEIVEKHGSRRRPPRRKSRRPSPASRTPDAAPTLFDGDPLE
ncbi:MAG: deoxyribodipyrimidine photolyase [Planctomycetaceae bacterium]|nr:deoxyribodipyrimidine photolyase [Planctomycetaceae bacterium]